MNICEHYGLLANQYLFSTNEVKICTFCAVSHSIQIYNYRYLFKYVQYFVWYVFNRFTRHESKRSIFDSLLPDIRTLFVHLNCLCDSLWKKRSFFNLFYLSLRNYWVICSAKCLYLSLYLNISRKISSWNVSNKPNWPKNRELNQSSVVTNIFYRFFPNWKRTQILTV